MTPDASDDSSLVGALTRATATWEPIKNDPETMKFAGRNMMRVILTQPHENNGEGRIAGSMETGRSGYW
jgi:hypothetical protein